jgi:hypothetical protein
MAFCDAWQLSITPQAGLSGHHDAVIEPFEGQ